LYKNLMDACVGAMAFWLLGYGFAYGNADDNKFIGTANFALSEETNEGGTYHSFFFQWAFSATAATIVSGSVAERCRLESYFIYSIFLTVFVYPVVVHWVWDTEGWLCAWGTGKVFSGVDEGPGGSNGLIDFAGSGVVHMVGGFSGLMGAIALGPRTGRFEPGNEEKFAPHNTLIAALGVVILWYGWYGFNAGSTLLVANGASSVAAKVCVTTTIAAAASACSCTIYSHFMLHRFDLMLSLNGALAGLVSITAGCSVVDPWAAAVIGILGSFVFIAFSALLKKLKIDDPLDAFPMHGMCGFWGVLAVGIFGTDDNVKFAYGNDVDAIARGEQFGVQFVGALAIAAWTVATAGGLFFVLKAAGILRVPLDIEAEGLDLSEHGGAAYNLGKDDTGLLLTEVKTDQAADAKDTKDTKDTTDTI